MCGKDHRSLTISGILPLLVVDMGLYVGCMLMNGFDLTFIDGMRLTLRSGV